jgi:hypothetical protein
VRMLKGRSAVVAVLIGAIAYSVGAVYLAGWLLLPMIGVGFKYHTAWVWLDYWMAYPQVRTGAGLKALLICLGLLAGGVGWL